MKPMRMRLPMLLILAPTLQAQAPGLAARVAEAEAVVARHFRGEPLESARAKVVADIAAFNAETTTATRELAAEKAALDARRAPLREMEAKLESLDRDLAKLPTATEGGDSPAERKHAAAVRERKALAERHEALRQAVQPQLEAYNARVTRSNETLKVRRNAVTEAQARLNARIDAFAAFQRQGGDVAFYSGLTRLLAECVKVHAEAPAAKARALRQELFRWAQARAAAQPFGPVLVEATVGGEPVCFMVDTGAERTSLSPELVATLGLEGRLGEEVTFVLAGGPRVKGRELTLPALAVAGASMAAVPAAVLPATEVGIDGLLGQSFLKGFVYTIDEGRPERLLLKPRKP